MGFPVRNSPPQGPYGVRLRAGLPAGQAGAISNGMKSSEEELAYLRERVSEKREELEIPEDHFESDRVIRRELAEYALVSPQELLHEAAVLPEHEILRHALRLEAEDIDAQIDALLRILAAHGIRNALSVAVRMKNPDLESDFIRILERFVAEGLPAQAGLPEKGAFPVERSRHAPHLVLYEMKPLKRGGYKLALAAASSEKIYSGLLSVIAAHEGFSLEIAAPPGTRDALIYLSVPRAKKTLAERLLASVSPGILISECRGDYNIFNRDGESAAAFARLSNHHAFPMKTYEMFSEDPMSSLFDAFSKVAKYGEGAALQFVVGNEGGRYNAHYRNMLNELKKQSPLSKVLLLPETSPGRSMHEAFETWPGTENGREGRVSEAARSIGRKIKSEVVPVVIRIAASARDKRRAREILDGLKASFDQYGDPSGNRLLFKDMGDWGMRRFLRDFARRACSPFSRMPLGLAEVATMMHFAR